MTKLFVVSGDDVGFIANDERMKNLVISCGEMTEENPFFIAPELAEKNGFPAEDDIEVNWQILPMRVKRVNTVLNVLKKFGVVNCGGHDFYTVVASEHKGLTNY